jgi:hypothetical protein
VALRAVNDDTPKCPKMGIAMDVLANEFFQESVGDFHVPPLLGTSLWDICLCRDGECPTGPVRQQKGRPDNRMIMTSDDQQGGG